ncbi:hypothetical protein K490DRAFT_53260 [Saccharata proteae CBS 121410]|uniref:Uncharacterized protein n=1 Tax=Saccharata proteae CBS 121410 TaxID=1314787 RepID=A0A9P4M056_9PEZI|nr:hypothetical protein K490DRAFT_53260 [Saccharata proteae CBS 121410]
MGVSDKVLHHVVRRGVAMAGDLAEQRRQRLSNDVQVWEKKSEELSATAIVVIGATMVFFTLMYASIQYTLRHVITTLCMIETPASSMTISVSEHSEPDAPLTKEDKESEAFLGRDLETVTIVNPKPITSKIRNTLKHMTAQAGFASRWRGLPYAMLYWLIVGTNSNILTQVLPVFPGRQLFVSIFWAILSARLHMFWTHATIAAPSNKGFLQRMSVSGFKALVLPTVVYEGASVAVFFLGIFMAGAFNADFQKLSEHVSRDDKSDAPATLVIYAKVAGAILIMLGACLFVVLPARVALTRVEASMLPEDDDTLVPFDRTFDGKVVPKVVGGTGAVGFADAWRSFNREARSRLIKLYLKIFLISTTFILVAVHVIFFEAWAFAGPAVMAYIKAASAQAQLDQEL